MNEQAIIFNSREQQLVGIHHGTESPSKKGVVIVVGGPQTRVGSHRQFVLLARQLATHGIPVFRFDYTGAGDSEGGITHFTDIDQDIANAIDAFMKINNEVTHVSLWGLCDAASAIALYVLRCQDERVKQLILLNPWVRQPASEAKVYLRSYYAKRLFQPSFWKKLFLGKLKINNSITDINHFHKQSKKSNLVGNFVDDMYDGLSHFSEPVCVILSGNDLTADEFKWLIKNEAKWRALTAKSSFVFHFVDHANHTFSDNNDRSKMFTITVKCIENQSCFESVK